MSYQSRERSEAVKSLTQDDLEEIREAFKLFDTDDSGKVSAPRAAPAGRRRMQR